MCLVAADKNEKQDGCEIYGDGRLNQAFSRSMVGLRFASRGQQADIVERQTVRLSRSLGNGEAKTAHVEQLMSGF